jgi:isopenicillin N synthase-like dioxygenase
MVKIQVIDFSLFTNGDATARETVVAQIYQACHEMGFLYLKKRLTILASGYVQNFKQLY